MKYIIAPLDLDTYEREIYFLLYSKMDFDTFKVKYTLEQLVQDSNSILNLSKPKVNRIIKKFISDNLLTEIQKGKRGNPTIYQITKMDDLAKQIRNESGTQVKQIRNESETNKPSNINGLEYTKKQIRNESGTQVKQIRNTNSTPINDKEKDNENDKEDIYTQEKEIFDYWNSKEGVIHSQEKSFNKNKISTAIKNLGREEILKAIDNLDKAVLNSNYYYNFKWNIYKFLKQSNGISNWLEDGQLLNDYLNKENNNAKSGNDNSKVETSTGSGIDWSKYEV